MPQRASVDADLLEHLCRVRGEPALMTDEVAEVVNAPPPIVVEQLEACAENGDVVCRRAPEEEGQRWWAPA